MKAAGSRKDFDALVCGHPGCRTRTGNVSVSNVVTTTSRGSGRRVSLSFRKSVRISEFSVAAFVFVDLLFLFLALRGHVMEVRGVARQAREPDSRRFRQQPLDGQQQLRKIERLFQQRTNPRA